MNRIFLPLLFLMISLSALGKGLKVTELTCELRSGLVVVESRPRLGWKMISDENGTTQSAYQIKVVDVNTGLMAFDSKKQISSKSQLHTLVMAEGYYEWNVRVWDETGKASDWSEPSRFIVQNEGKAFAGAKWVGAITKADSHTPEGREFTGAALKAAIPEWDKADPLSRRSIYVAKDVRLDSQKRIASVIMNVCGLGFSETTINGEKIGDAEFSPTWSDYDKSVFYNTYDITDKIDAFGRNRTFRVETLLGNGFYNEQGGRYHKLRISFGPPTLKMCIAVKYIDGSFENIVTDDSWQYSPSELTFNSIYGGEDYDAGQHREWHPVVLQEGPKGVLRPQMAPPVKVMKTYSPVSRKTLSDEERESAVKLTKHELPAGTFVLDMGQNLSGVPEIKVSGKAGQKVTIYVSETLTPEGACNQRQTGRQHCYVYTLKGDGVETYRPRFSYYGFRYIQVEGAVMKGDSNPLGYPVLEDVKSCFVHNSAKTVSEFECSNELVNKTHDLIDKATRSNMQSVFTDCPHREKLGWLEQDWLNGPGLFMNYDLTGFAAQTVQVIADSQRPNGSVPTTAPEYVVFKGGIMDLFAESPEWGGTFIMMPWMYYQQYGDDSLLRKHYEKMLAYVDYLAEVDSCGILSQGLGDWYDYGDFKAGFAHNTSVPLVSTAHHYRWAMQMSKIADMLGRRGDASRLAARAEEIKAAWQKKFYPSECLKSQTGMAIALNLCLCPDDDRSMVLDSLKADIKRHDTRLTTGDVGNRYLYEVLCEENEQELLYAMLNHDDVPGYGFQMKKGMTTLSEQWNPEMGSSMNHFMMGQIDGFHFTSLCGINVSNKVVTFRPQPVDDITYASGSTITPYGKVSIKWEKNAGSGVANVEIPVGMTGVFVDAKGAKTTLTSGHHKVVM